MRGGSYKPKVRQFDVGDFVYLLWQPNDTLDISPSHTFLKIKMIRPLGVLELQRVDVRLAICQTWILPSSHRFKFLHLTIHVRYVGRQRMLIKCCFAIIVMVDTIYYAPSRSSFKFPLTFGIVHHVLLHHFDFYLDHATFFPAQV
jgi:hypothetical protein